MYRICMMGSRFCIDVEKIPKALAALKKSSRRLDKKRSEIICVARTLRECGWETNDNISANLDGGEETVVGIEDISWNCGKFTDESEKVLAILAPFVEKGSHIDIIDWDYKVWRYYFTGRKMVTIPGKITFSKQG
jgi:hypothetical protein